MNQRKMLDAFQLTGKNALVTGSHRGLGAAIAMALAQACANVAVHGRSGESRLVMDAVREAGSTAIAVAGNVADAKVCEQIVEVTVRELGSLDILVNNAGIIRRTPAVNFSAQDWDGAASSSVRRSVGRCAPHESHHRRRHLVQDLPPLS